MALDGILAVADIYSVAELAAINSAMDPMLDAGLFDRVLSRKMKDLILSVVPDPVLYHFHAYEIEANSTKSHIFGETLGGWHRDPDSEFFPGDPTHISVFVYLTDVGDYDGAFEFSSHPPCQPLRTDSPVLSMTGPTGMSFVWHRSYYHRASPNRGDRRRRMLKISVQRNFFISNHLNDDFFKRVCAEVPEGDLETDMLLGRYQQRQAPELTQSQVLSFFHLKSSQSIDLSGDMLVHTKRQEAASVGEPPAYD